MSLTKKTIQSLMLIGTLVLAVGCATTSSNGSAVAGSGGTTPTSVNPELAIDDDSTADDVSSFETIDPASAIPSGPYASQVEPSTCAPGTGYDPSLPR